MVGPFLEYLVLSWDSVVYYLLVDVIFNISWINCAVRVNMKSFVNILISGCAGDACAFVYELSTQVYCIGWILAQKGSTIPCYRYPCSSGQCTERVCVSCGEI